MTLFIIYNRNQKYFYCFSSLIPSQMFLQKYRKSHQKEFASPEKQLGRTSKITDLLKKMNPSEIKQHQRVNIYVNPRTYLIENTRKVIRPVHKQIKENVNSQIDKETETFISSAKNKEVFHRTHVDLTSREARRLAAKSFRERIWKSSDITPLVKAQEQKLLRKRKGYYQSFNEFADVQQKIHRYQDSFNLTNQESQIQRKETLKKQWLEEAMKNNLNLRTNSSQKNPQKLQITNIEFKEQMQESTGSNHSRQVINRQRRKELRMLHYSSLVRQEKRPNTTGGYNREKIDENIIEPW